MRDILLMFVYLSFVLGGFIAPFAFLLGYVWVDLSTPQLVAFSGFWSFPSAAIMGSLAIITHTVFSRQPYKGISSVSVLLLLLAAWSTLTCFWAAAPEYAWKKWDWAVKSLLFAAFLPFTINSRSHIDSLLWIVVVSVGMHTIPFGIKTLLTGGGYGQALGLLATNAGFGEASTLAVAAVALIPIHLYLLRYSTDYFGMRFRQSICVLLAGSSLLTAIGTHARAGLLSLVALGAISLYRSQRRVAMLLALVAATGFIAFIAGDSWYGRMSSLGEVQSNQSAMGRLAVWMWTLDFVRENPLGGGFNAYLVGRYSVPFGDGEQMLEVTAKAFHSAYFEILGEQGFPGALLYLMVIGSTLVGLSRIVATRGNPHSTEWVVEVANAVLISQIVCLVGISVIGVAYQPFFLYIFAIAAAISRFSRTNGMSPER